MLLKSIANTNTNSFVTIRFTVYYIQQSSFFHGQLLIKLIEWLLSRNGKITIVYSGTMSHE